MCRLVDKREMDASVVSSMASVKENTGSASESKTGADTFKTGVDFDDDEDLASQARSALTMQDLRLPNGYDVVAIRETLLSEAPFVSRGSRAFWRRMMDTEEFVGTITNMYHHILGVISDSGVIHMDKLDDIHDSILIETMSNHFANIYFGLSQHERDIFLPKLPELLIFMVINALQAALPKHQRLYMSVKFREILLDWTGELFNGMRGSSSKVGRDWLFQDCNDMQVMTAVHSNQFLSSLDGTLTRRKKHAVCPISTARSYYNFDHSPLVKMYIERNNPGALQIKNKLRVTLSHYPERPLVTLQEGLRKTVRLRERYTDDKRVKRTIQRGKNQRKELMEGYEKARNGYKRDTHRIREALKYRMAELSGKSLSAKEEYLASSATLGGAEFGHH